jgi:hypothetical protein
VARKSKSAKAREFIQNNPQASVSEICEKFGFPKAYVYVLRSEMKKKQSGVKARLASPESLKREMALDTEAAVKQPEPVNQPDPVNHPAHYTFGGIETIDFIEAKRLNYNLGNAIKYIARSPYKHAYVQDLKKAVWYLEREIERTAA